MLANEKALFVVLLFAVLLPASLAVPKVSASSIPKPSVPEFTMLYNEHYYDVPPTYGTDQFTGETIITRQGYRADNRSMTFQIKNQPNTYTPVGINTKVYYNFRYKGHYGNDWMHYPFNENGLSGRYSALWYSFGELPRFEASANEYTELSIKITDLFRANSPQADGEIDVQVQTQIGYIEYLGDGYYSFKGESSDWSPIQSISIDEVTPTATPNLTATPDQAVTQTNVVLGLSWEQTAIALLCIAVIVLIIALVFSKRRKVQGDRL
jgi:hypothetical protein